MCAPRFIHINTTADCYLRLAIHNAYYIHTYPQVVEFLMTCIQSDSGMMTHPFSNTRDIYVCFSLCVIPHVLYPNNNAASIDTVLPPWLAELAHECLWCSQLAQCTRQYILIYMYTYTFAWPLLWCALQSKQLHTVLASLVAGGVPYFQATAALSVSCLET